MNHDLTTNEESVAADPEETRKKSGMPDLTTLEGAHEQIANLEIAVEHRTVIGQAVGILQERFGMDSERAFAVLARLSQERNIKLYTLATTLAEHGHIDL